MTKQTEKVTLDFYHPKYEETLHAFYLPEEQQKFTATPAEIIKRAEEEKECTPIVIISNEKPVGIFALLTGEKVKGYTENENALALVSFSVNHHEQGNGYAVKALLQLHRFIHSNFPGKDEVLLVVNEKNIAAQRAYKKAGFQDTGHRRMGPVGGQFVFSLSIKDESFV